MTTQQKTISLFLCHPEFFVKIISAFYPFSEAELHKYKEVIDWDLINQNGAIAWNEKLIREYNSKIDWVEFSRNASLANTGLLEMLKDQLDWNAEDEDCFGCSVASNQSIIWTPELIEKYLDRLNFHHLSVNEQVQWSEQLLDCYKDRWIWDHLMMNDSIPWTLPMLNRFISYIDTTGFNFQVNTVLTSQLDIIAAYPDHFSTYTICRNPKLPWKEKNLLMRWLDKLDWNGIAGNETLFKDPYFFEDHLDRWLGGPTDKFKFLAKNKSLPWSIPFIKRFSNRWNWEYLSTCPHLPWTEELIDYFEDDWEWGGQYINYITEDEDGNRLPRPWATSLAYSEGLVTNPSLPWSVDFIEKYKQRLEFKQLAENKGVWEKAFKPFVDGKMIDTIFRLI